MIFTLGRTTAVVALRGRIVKGLGSTASVLPVQAPLLARRFPQISRLHLATINVILESPLRIEAPDRRPRYLRPLTIIPTTATNSPPGKRLFLVGCLLIGLQGILRRVMPPAGRTRWARRCMSGTINIETRDLWTIPPTGATVGIIKMHRWSRDAVVAASPATSGANIGKHVTRRQRCSPDGVFWRGQNRAGIPPTTATTAM